MLVQFCDLLHPCEYTHEIASSQGAKKVTMTSPVR